MFFEILVEDLSGEKMLQALLPKILSKEDTFKIHKYKGAGHIPKNLKSGLDANKRVLLDQLPKLLSGIGKTHAGYGDTYEAAVIVVVDSDAKCPVTFKQELVAILDTCAVKPNAFFCLAVEEGEAWLLGDTDAIKRAYPSAKEEILQGYVNDSICGTWELLADALYPKGSAALKKLPYSQIGAIKCEWAEKITPFLVTTKNKSPSFNYFYTKIKDTSKIKK
jgi:hypothetical protein